MRKIMWLGLAVLVLVLMGVAAIITAPATAPGGSVATRWTAWAGLVLLGAITLWAFRAASVREPRPEAMQTRTDVATSDTSQAGAQTLPPPAPLHVLASAVATVAGRDTATVLQTLCDAPPLPKPDAALLDERGLPRLSARCEGLDLAAVLATLDAPPSGSSTLRESVVRALALQSAALEDLMASIPPGDDELDVLWMVPAHWSEPERTQATSWLAKTLSAYRTDDAPEARIHLLGAAEAATTLQRLRVHAGPMRTDSDRAGRTGRAIALACDSRIEADSAPMGSQGSPSLPPGEAAAALLLWRAAPGSPSAPPDGVPQSSLLRLVAPAATSDSSPRSTVALRELTAQALEGADLREDIAWAVSDVGLAGSSARDVLDTIVERVPGLDVSQRLCRLGTACGDVGAATSLVALALASQAASQAPTVLLLSGREPAVAVLAPPLPASSPAPL